MSTNTQETSITSSHPSLRSNIEVGARKGDKYEACDLFIRFAVMCQYNYQIYASLGLFADLRLSPSPS